MPFIHEKKFTEQNTNIFDSFVRGANNGLKTGKSIFPYALGMLVAISLFRNSGLFEIISNFIFYPILSFWGSQGDYGFFFCGFTTAIFIKWLTRFYD